MMDGGYTAGSNHSCWVFGNQPLVDDSTAGCMLSWPVATQRPVYVDFYASYPEQRKSEDGYHLTMMPGGGFYPTYRLRDPGLYGCRRVPTIRIGRPAVTLRTCRSLAPRARSTRRGRQLGGRRMWRRARMVSP